MSGTIRFLLAHLALVFFGAAAAFHPSVRRLGTAFRLSAAFAAGAVALTAEAVVESALGIPWSAAGLAMPLLALSFVLGRRWARRPAEDTPAPFRVSLPVAILAALAIGAALWHLFATLLTARATSPDYVYFWGVKAAQFYDARGIDVDLLKWAFFAHGVPEYPPLVPIVGAWSALVAGRMQWMAGVAASGLWLVATIPPVLVLLRRRVRDDLAFAGTAFWTAALAVSLAWSYSGGIAEAPLLFFETVATAGLLTEDGSERELSRFLPALALAGAALTKIEGTLGAVALILGVAARDALGGRPNVWRRALPLAASVASALALWFGFQLVAGLPVGFRGHGLLWDLHGSHLAAILREMAIDARAGTFGVSWLVPLAILLFAAKDRRAALPGISIAAAILAFLVFDYLHDPQHPWERIGWTLPRVSQPALSALILGACVASGSRPRPRGG